jgi:acetyl-CoA C-acetyltransferase
MVQAFVVDAVRTAVGKRGGGFANEHPADIPVMLAWLAELDADPERVNPNGGAIALGHPIGCTGARLMTSLLHELERTRGRYGLQTMCEGGGQANVTIIERL